MIRPSGDRRSSVEKQPRVHKVELVLTEVRLSFGFIPFKHYKSTQFVYTFQQAFLGACNPLVFLQLINIPHVDMRTCLHVGFRLSRDAVEPVLLEKKIDGLFAQSLRRAFKIEG